MTWSRYYLMALQQQNTLALEVNKQRNTVWARKVTKKYARSLPEGEVLVVGHASVLSFLFSSASLSLKKQKL